MRSLFFVLPLLSLLLPASLPAASPVQYKELGVWPKADAGKPLGGWESWRFSLDKMPYSLQYHKTGGPDGGPFIRLESDNDRYWMFTSEQFEIDRDGKTLVAMTKMRVPEGHANFRIFGVKGRDVTKGRLISAFTSTGDQWKNALAMFDTDYDRIYFIFSGPGKIKVDFSPVALKTATFATSKREKIDGFAKERRAEKLDRGLLALTTGDGVRLGWRLLDTDADGLGFLVERRAKGESAFVRLTEKPIATTTDFLDATAKNGVEYTYRVSADRPAVVCGVAETTIAVPGTNEERKPYISIPLRGDFCAQAVCMADVDGDGRLDYIVKHPAGSIDPGEGYWVRCTDTYKIDVYKSDGTFLWRHDLGWGVEAGIWYSPFLAYDLDGDGRAEVVTRTVKEPGDPRDKDGRVHSENEYATVFDGQTGRVVAETPWVSRDLLGYNLASRNFLGVAYLDGKTPFLIVQRGTYSIIRISAYQLVNGKLEEKMSWSNIYGPAPTLGGGAHRLHAVDLDGDGREELCVGSFVLDDDGSVLWSLGLGHPDLLCVGDLNPDVPGLEMYLGVETSNKSNGMCMVKAATGEYIWGLDKESWHIGSGNCVDIDPNRPGSECSGCEMKNDHSTARYWFSASGEKFGEGKDNALNQAAGGKLAVYWDDSAQRVFLRGNEKRGVFMKMNFEKGKAPGFSFLPETFAGKPLTAGDFFGDWREEFITTLPGELRVYSTTRPAKDRRVCLLQDRNYRATTVENTVGYWSKPTLSYDMQSTPPGK